MRNPSQRDALDSEEEDPIFRRVGVEDNPPEMRRVMTDKVIQICKTFLQSLKSCEMPFIVRFMIKTIIDKT